MKKYAHPSTINTDRNPTYSKAIAKLKTEGVYSLELEHRGFEVMQMFKKGRFDFWKYGQSIFGEIRIITNNLLAC